MGLGGENGKVETWEVGKSKGVKKKKKKEVVEAKGGVGEEEIGCWVRLWFLRSYISSRSKADSSISGTTTHYANSCLSLSAIFFMHLYGLYIWCIGTHRYRNIHSHGQFGIASETKFKTLIRMARD